MANNDYLSVDQFISFLEFLNINDTNMSAALFSFYSIEEKLSYLNFVELMLPISPEKSIKMSRKVTNSSNFNKLQFFQSDKYISTKNILRSIFNYHISIQRNYLLIRDQIYADKKFNLQNAFIEISNSFSEDQYILEDDITINTNDIKEYLIRTEYQSNNEHEGYFIDEFLNVILSKMSPRSKSGDLSLRQFKLFFCID